MVPLFLLSMLVCLIGWVVGETRDNKLVRVASTLAGFVVIFFGTAITTGRQTAATTVLLTSSSIRYYIGTAAEQIRDGNSEFVASRFSEFVNGVPATYELPRFLEDFAAHTARMKDGPDADRKSAPEESSQPSSNSVGE